jgi:hypothetical protein
MRASYEERLKIPIEGSDAIAFCSLCSSSGLLLATGYTKVVIGDRGPYVEFSRFQIIWLAFSLVDQWRVSSDVAYYVEYRSRCDANVKLYLQKKHVTYADYKVGFCYISPFDLYLLDGTVLIEKLK